MTDEERCHLEQARAAAYLAEFPNGAEARGARLGLADWMMEEMLIMTKEQRLQEIKRERPKCYEPADLSDYIESLQERIAELKPDLLFLDINMPGRDGFQLLEALERTPLVIFGGKEYGTGSSRDWAAKGTILLGVKAVITESFERIHRSNLVGMGVLPLVFKNGMTRADLKLSGDEVVSITGIEKGITPRMDVTLTITRKDGTTDTHTLLCRIDTADEVDYYVNGGVLNYVLRGLAK